MNHGKGFDKLFDSAALDDDKDSVFVPIAKPKKKRLNYVKKVERQWSHDEILQLIAEVEERPVLWDIGSPVYKLPKAEDWKEVANAIGNINVDDAKAKWTNLRISFKNNLAKLRSKKSGQGTNEAVAIRWRYFKSLMFLEANDIQQTAEPTSSLTLACAKTDASVLDDFKVAPPLPSGVVVGTHNRPSNPGLSSTPSPSPSSTASINSVRELAFNALGSFRVHDDKFSAFGDYIASELRALPPDRGSFVQRGLNRELLRLLEAAENQVPPPTQQAPVRFTDESNCDSDSQF